MLSNQVTLLVYEYEQTKAKFPPLNSLAYCLFHSSHATRHYLSIGIDTVKLMEY